MAFRSLNISAIARKVATGSFTILKLHIRNNIIVRLRDLRLPEMNF